MYGTSDFLGLEKSHKLTLKFLNTIQNSELLMNLLKTRYHYTSDRLNNTVLGYDFRNPVGVAAGFDKNAKIVPVLQSLGFGYIEVGTVTPDRQSGNQKPRMFRLKEDNAIINRLGFNNDGMKEVHKRLSSYDTEVPIGVNIGKMNDSGYEKGLEDYKKLANCFGDHPSYYVLNVSCPNTPEKYDEQSSTNIRETVNSVNKNAKDTPVLIKISPDETETQLDSISKVVRDTDINGVIATNTTEDRPENLVSDYKSQEGGLSGEPLRTKSNRIIRHLYASTDVPIIGVGGVSDGQTAFQKIISGSSLVQIYTGIVYNGLKSAYKINRELESILRKNGFESVSEAVGSDV